VGHALQERITMETKKQAAHANFYSHHRARLQRQRGASFERSDISNEITAVSSVSVKRNWGGTNLERSLTSEFQRGQDRRAWNRRAARACR
jgi:translocation and assembly module TamA